MNHVSYILVLGQVGEGKSSLIQHFFNRTSRQDKERIYRQVLRRWYWPGPARVGDNYTGVTSRAELYAVRIGERDVILIDTPGIGDREFNLALIAQVIQRVTPLHGVIFVKNIFKRFTLGDRAIPRIINVAIQSVNNDHDVWESVILVATRKDKLLRKRIQPEEKLGELRGAIFQETGAHIRHAATVSLPADNDHEVQDFVNLINNLNFDNELEFSNPSDAQMAGVYVESRWNVNVTEESYRIEREGATWGNLALIAAGATGVVFGLASGGIGLIGGTVMAVGINRFFGRSVEEIRRGPLWSVSIADDRDDTVAMCALLSSIVYHVQTVPELNLILMSSMMDFIGTRRFDEFLPHTDVRPGADPMERDYDHRFISLVAMNLRGKNTLFIAWKGSQGVPEFLTNANVRPTTCPLWHEIFPNFRVHSGMVTIIMNCINLFRGTLVDLVRQHQIRQIVFTGHSLGGGLAQIALMAYIAQRTIGSLDPALVNVNICAYAFASPMVFSIPEMNSLGEQELDALAEFRYQCHLLIYEKDMVPHMPANREFWIPAFRTLLSEGAVQAVETPMVGNTLRCLFVRNLANNAFDYVAETIGDVIDQLVSEYKHIAQLYYFNPELNHFTPEHLTEVRFDEASTADEILESHLVLPHCVGLYMVNRRNWFNNANRLLPDFRAHNM